MERYLLENFWIILKVWSIAERDIMGRRGRHPSNYMEHLEGLKEMARIYVTTYKDKYPQTYDEFCSDETLAIRMHPISMNVDYVFERM